jgi:hypothetical protein
MITVTSNLQWNGNRVKRDIKLKLHLGVRNAVQHFYDELQKTLSKWGSIPFMGNYRIRVNHSSPGQPPLRQTSNLYNSIRPDISPVTDVLYVGGGSLVGGEEITGEISTDVDYAPTLELGGSLNAGGYKRHTTIRLANPVQGDISIAPRPAWIPTFLKSAPKMVNLIRRG